MPQTAEFVASNIVLTVYYVDWPLMGLHAPEANESGLDYGGEMQTVTAFEVEEASTAVEVVGAAAEE